jgi:3-mercaptopyruvate sulfurtransferase SseA
MPTLDRNQSPVTEFPAAPPHDAETHFGALLAHETDCWDVHEAFERGVVDFVLLDVRSPDLFAQGHVPGAINLSHGASSTETSCRSPMAPSSSCTAPVRTATAPTRPPCAWRDWAAR